jgi:hypothetical protein
MRTSGRRDRAAGALRFALALVLSPESIVVGMSLS